MDKRVEIEKLQVKAEGWRQVNAFVDQLIKKNTKEYATNPYPGVVGELQGTFASIMIDLEIHHPEAYERVLTRFL